MRLMLLLVLGLVACGGEDARSSSSGGAGAGGGGGGDPTECAPGELAVEGEGCRPAGLPPGWQAPGPTVEPSAGVPPGSCGEGFVADGERGCAPILPATPCPDGMMAVPGDATCRPVADCGTGPWGDIAVDAGTIYVDAAFAGVPDGSAGSPFSTIQAAVDASSPGNVIAVAAGSYVEDVVIDDHAVVLWGRCPQLVSVTGVASLETIGVSGVAGATVRGLDVTGPNSAVGVTNGPGTMLMEIRAHDTGAPAIYVDGGGAETVLSDSLIERSTFTGALVLGAKLGVERSEVRHGTPFMDIGRAVDVFEEGGVPGEVRLVASHIHHATDVGVLVEGSTLLVERTVVSDTIYTSGNSGHGVQLRDSPASGSTGTITRCVFARNVETSILVAGSSLTMDAVTIEDGSATPEGFSRGLWIYDGLATMEPGEVTVTDSVIRDQPSIGVEVVGSELQAQGLLLQRVESVLDDLALGVHPRRSDDGVRGSVVTLSGSIIEDTAADAVFVDGSTASVVDSVIRRVGDDVSSTAPVGVVGVDAGGVPADVSLVATRIERVIGYGAVALSSRLSADRVHVANIDEAAATVDTGIGVSATVQEGGPSDLVVSSSLIEATTGVALAGLDSTVAIDGTRIATGATRGVVLERATATVDWSEVRDVVNVGVFAIASDVTSSGLLVDGVIDPLDDAGSAAVAVVEFDQGAASMTLRGVRLTNAAAAGIVVDGATLTLEDGAITDVLPDTQGSFGRAVIAQNGAQLTITHSSIERTHEIGVHLLGADAQLDGLAIADILPSADSGLYGDGLVASLGANVMLSNSRVTDVTRAALAVFGAHLALEDNDLRCTELPLNLEAGSAGAGALDDLGGNRCGCETEVACKAQSANLAPPEALPAPEEG